MLIFPGAKHQDYCSIFRGYSALCAMCANCPSFWVVQLRHIRLLCSYFSRTVPTPEYFISVSSMKGEIFLFQPVSHFPLAFVPSTSCILFTYNPQFIPFNFTLSLIFSFPLTVRFASITVAFPRPIGSNFSVIWQW